MIQDRSFSSHAVGAFVHLLAAFVLVVTLYPILHIASISLSSNDEVVWNNVTFFPRDFNLDAYKVIVHAPSIPRAYKNSFVYMGLGVTVNLLMTVSMAYALSKKRLPFHGFFTWSIIIPFFFSGGLIPTYLLVRSLGMYNTIWALVIPEAIAVWNLVILRIFFQTIPQELEDSALIDGANEAVILTRIIIPISMAGIAVITLFYAVGHWNSWFPAVIYLRDAMRHPLQVVLRNIIMENQLSDLQAANMDLAESIRLQVEGKKDDYVNEVRLMYGILFASIVPMLVIYPFIQKYFVKGIMIGSLKG